MNRLIIATRNRHKTAEIAAMLGASWTIEDLTARPELPEPEETGATFDDNAQIKAIAASLALPCMVLSDDSGLEVDLLNGRPGVRSARYAGEDATDQQNNDLLLAELKTRRPAGDAPVTARFRCAMAIAEAGKVLATFSGAVEGRIAESESGPNGFGYDPLFIPDGFTQTFGEIPSTIKNQLSHRARALQQAVKWLAAL